MISGLPPRSEATHASPAAAASSSACDRPSYSLGSTSTSARARCRRTSARGLSPWNRTRPSTPSRARQRADPRSGRPIARQVELDAVHARERLEQELEPLVVDDAADPEDLERHARRPRARGEAGELGQVYAVVDRDGARRLHAPAEDQAPEVVARRDDAPGASCGRVLAGRPAPPRAAHRRRGLELVERQLGQSFSAGALPREVADHLHGVASPAGPAGPGGGPLEAVAEDHVVSPGLAPERPQEARAAARAAPTRRPQQAEWPGLPERRARVVGAAHDGHPMPRLDQRRPQRGDERGRAADVRREDVGDQQHAAHRRITAVRWAITRSA